MAVESYYPRLLAACVRGCLGDSLGSLADRPLGSLADEDLATLYAHGKAAKLELAKFKRSAILPRVRRSLGILKSLCPASLLDIGSGRGTFLWPLLEAFPELPVLAVDASPQHCESIGSVHRGGVLTVKSLCCDARSLPLGDQSHDVVTALEVFEHIQDIGPAVAEVVRVATRAVVFSVPSTPDENPEHVHFFSEEELSALFARAGAGPVRFSHVPDHLLGVVTL